MNITQVLNLLNIIAVLEPVAQNAILAFVQKLEGKTTDEILNEADSIWADVLSTAQAEQGGAHPTPGE